MSDAPQDYLIAAAGREYIRQALSVNDPKSVISEVQSKYSLHQPFVNEAYPMLETSGCPRRVVNTACLDALKKEVLAKIDAGLSDEQHARMLVSTLPYLQVVQLRQVPLALLRIKPESITKDAMHAIMDDPELFEECPIAVKRHMWTVEPSLFYAFVAPLLDAYRQDGEMKDAARELRPTNLAATIGLRRNHPTIRTLVEAIYDNLPLYNAVLGILRQGFLKSGDPMYCTLRFDLLMKMHESDIRAIITKDPCHQLVWFLDACYRNQVMDERRLSDMQGYLATVSPGGPVYGEIGMVLYSDFVTQIFSLQLFNNIAHPDSAKPHKTEHSLRWVATRLKHGMLAQKMLETRVFEEVEYDRNLVRGFMSTLRRIVASDTRRNRDLHHRYPDQPTDLVGFDYHPQGDDQGADGSDTLPLIEELNQTVAVDEVAIRIFSQYTLDRLLRLDLPALTQALPVYSLYLASTAGDMNVDKSSDRAEAAIRSVWEAFIQSFVSCIIADLRPLYVPILKYGRLHEILIDRFLVASAETSPFALRQVFRLCTYLQSHLLSAHSNLSDGLSSEHRTDAFRLIAEWAEDACRVGLGHLASGAGGTPLLPEVRTELVAAAQTLVQKSPPAAGAHQLTLRSCPHVKAFLDAGTGQP